MKLSPNLPEWHDYERGIWQNGEKIRQNDDFVNGHIIEGLNKMKAEQFVSLVEPYTTDKNTWKRNQAKKYIKGYGT